MNSSVKFYQPRMSKMVVTIAVATVISTATFLFGVGIGYFFASLTGA
jgi:hypothetical protein